MLRKIVHQVGFIEKTAPRS